MSQWQACRVLDARGLSCPQSIIQARTALREMEPGQVLEIQGDDPTLEENLTAFAGRSGDELLECQARQGYVSFFLRRC